MAKLTLVELNNSSQIFGQSEYAMFSATTETGQTIEIGLTHKSLERRQFDTDNLESLLGCQVVTKEYTDNRTGEIVNPDERIENILAGEGRLLLLNSINSTIIKSTLYKQEAKDLAAATQAKAKVEFAEKKKQAALQASLERMRLRALTNLSTTDIPTPAEPTIEAAAETAEEELGF